MPVNVEKLHEELRFLTINPDKWNQGLWVKVEQVERPGRPSACGSFGCLAGNTVVHEDMELLWYEDEETVWVRDKHGDMVWDRNGNPIPTRNEDGTTKRVVFWHADDTIVGVDEDGVPIVRSIHDAARDELGLNEHQAGKLFSPDNTESELWDLAEKLTLGEISSWDYDRALRDRDYQAKLKGSIENLENASANPA